MLNEIVELLVQCDIGYRSVEEKYTWVNNRRNMNVEMVERGKTEMDSMREYWAHSRMLLTLFWNFSLLTIIWNFGFLLNFLLIQLTCNRYIFFRTYVGFRIMRKLQVKSVIERPSVPATYRLANFALLYNKKNKIDPKMADDVIEICRRELDQWRSKKTPVALPGILRKKSQKGKQPQK